jgi:DtxR family transcriptional regulator, Mn-dependent transcriptional regulator
MVRPEAEEILESLYLWQAEGGPYPADHIAAAAMAEVLAANLAELADGRYRLTSAGHDAGQDVIRRHRLAERLLADVLAGSPDQMEDDACRFEHVLVRHLADQVCTLLGHPTTCPHGKVIPPGPCCLESRTISAAPVGPLSAGKVGSCGTVAYLTTRDSRAVQKLMAMGVLPGSPIQLIRRWPSYVFQLGYSQFTVDRPLAAAVYVNWDRR